MFKIAGARFVTNQLIQLLLCYFSIVSIPPLCYQQIWDMFPPYLFLFILAVFVILSPSQFVARLFRMQMKCEREPGWPTMTSSQATESSMPLTMWSKFAHSNNKNNKNNNNRKRIKLKSDKSLRAIGLSQAHPNMQCWEQRLIVLIPAHRESSYNLHWGELHLTVRDK